MAYITMFARLYQQQTTGNEFLFEKSRKKLSKANVETKCGISHAANRNRSRRAKVYGDQYIICQRIFNFPLPRIEQAPPHMEFSKCALSCLREDNATNMSQTPRLTVSYQRKFIW